MISRDLEIRRELNGKGKMNILKRGTTKGAINLEEKASNRGLESLETWKRENIETVWTMEIERRSFTMEKRLGTKSRPVQ